MTIFEEVRERVSITDAISYLGVKPTETKGDQLRFACPHCKGTDRRTLSINTGSGKFQCFTAKKGGNDATALVAHAHGISQTDAAKQLKEHFLGSSTEARPEKVERKGRSDASTEDVVRPLDLLGISDEIADRLHIQVEEGRILFELRDDRGTKLGTLAIATRADLPLIEWTGEAEVKADTPAAGTDLKSLWRVVKGGA